MNWKAAAWAAGGVLLAGIAVCAWWLRDVLSVVEGRF